MGLKRRLGITAWQVFSDDMQQGIKQIQDTSAFKKTAEGISAVKVRSPGDSGLPFETQTYVVLYFLADEDRLCVDLLGVVKLLPEHD